MAGGPITPSECVFRAWPFRLGSYLESNLLLTPHFTPTPFLPCHIVRAKNDTEDLGNIAKEADGTESSTSRAGRPSTNHFQGHCFFEAMYHQQDIREGQGQVQRYGNMGCHCGRAC